MTAPRSLRLTPAKRGCSPFWSVTPPMKAPPAKGVRGVRSAASTRMSLSGREWTSIARAASTTVAIRAGVNPSKTIDALPMRTGRDTAVSVSSTKVLKDLVCGRDVEVCVELLKTCVIQFNLGPLINDTLIGCRQ